MTQESPENRPDPEAEARRLAELLSTKNDELDRLHEVLDDVETKLGVDNASATVFPPQGAMFREEPQAMPEADVVAENQPMPATPIDSPPLIAKRDPAVLELLQQSAGLSQRCEHLRVMMDNIDKKVDLLGQEFMAAREATIRKEVADEIAKKNSSFFGQRRDEFHRLIFMAAVLMLVILVWRLLV